LECRQQSIDKRRERDAPEQSTIAQGLLHAPLPGGPEHRLDRLKQPDSAAVDCERVQAGALVTDGVSWLVRNEKVESSENPKAALL
jgi:hypothetical protein